VGATAPLGEEAIPATYDEEVAELATNEFADLLRRAY